MSAGSWRVRALGGVLAVAAVAVLGGLTRFGYDLDTGAGELRLAWRAVITGEQECRPLTPEEQAELPAHMRRTEICHDNATGYGLSVVVDGVEEHRSVVEAAGARGDRPLYVFETLPLDTGTHRIRISFRRRTDGAAPGRFPASLVVERVVEIAPRDVVLVTYDPRSRALVTRAQHR